MLHHALQGPHQSIGVLYSARTLSDFAYGDELQALARDGRIQLRQTVTRKPGAKTGMARWDGSVQLNSARSGTTATRCASSAGRRPSFTTCRSCWASAGCRQPFIRIEEWGVNIRERVDGHGESGRLYVTRPSHYRPIT